jgi:hypothetical protein
MDFSLLLIAVAVGAHFVRVRDQKQRIALLGRHLASYDIEKLMESLTAGYLRALGESDPDRQAQIWHLLASTQARLSEQFNQFAIAVAKLGAASTRVSKLPVVIPYATRLFPGASFDFRKALRVHALGLQEASMACANAAEDGNTKRRAFTMMAEILLMQHTCHWYCRSEAIASARLLKRHQTTYAQVLESVSPATRQAYGTLTGR